MFAGTGQGSTQGEIYMLGAVVSWIAYTLLGRRALGVISPLAATTWAALFGFVLLALCLLVAATAQVPHVLTPSSAGAILYLAVGGTVLPFVWYYQGVKALGPARTAVFTNLVPVFGVLLGATLLEEPVGLSMIAGGALVMAGISITNRG
jgi:drug/metabolite transporter (DMT)-like permease